MEIFTQKMEIDTMQNKGFCIVTGFNCLYVNSKGIIFNGKTGNYLRPNRKNYVYVDGKPLHVAKLVLQAFGRQSYRKGQITYLDGNKRNLDVNNLIYTRIIAPDRKYKVHAGDLIFAIRCYFSVTEKFNVNDSFKVRLYLGAIAEKRMFFENWSNFQYVGVFKTYLNSIYKTISDIAKEFGISKRDCSGLIEMYKQVIVADILADIDHNKAYCKEFSKEHKNKDKASVKVLLKKRDEILKQMCNRPS